MFELSQIQGLFNKDRTISKKKNLYFLKYSIYNRAFRVFTIKCYIFHPTPSLIITYALKSVLCQMLKTVSAAPNAAYGDSKQRRLRSLIPVGNTQKITRYEVGPYHARSKNPKHVALCASAHYRDATFIDHCDNVIGYMGYAH